MGRAWVGRAWSPKDENRGSGRTYPSALCRRPRASGGQGRPRVACQPTRRARAARRVVAPRSPPALRRPPARRSRAGHHVCAPDVRRDGSRRSRGSRMQLTTPCRVSSATVLGNSMRPGNVPVGNSVPARSWRDLTPDGDGGRHRNTGALAGVALPAGLNSRTGTGAPHFHEQRHRRHGAAQAVGR